MNRILVLIVLFFTANLSWAQTPGDVVRDVRENTASASMLMKALQKHVSSRDYKSFSDVNRWDTVGFLDHKKITECYSYPTLWPNGDTAYIMVYLNVTYKDDQVGYIKVEEEKYDFDSSRRCQHVIFKYVDSSYTKKALTPYNNTHNTDFTWVDLYEDALNYFGGLPGLYETRKIATPEELEKGIWWDLPSYITDEYEPLLVKRDHKSIIRHCKSFNPARKAYGAYCLYLLKKEGIILSEEEDELLKKISSSNEKTEFHAGCLGYRNIRLSSFLCREQLEPTLDELQTPSYLVYAVQSNLASATAFLKKLQVLAAEKKQKGEWSTYDVGTGLLDHKRIVQRFNYSQRNWQLDSIVHSYVMVHAVYKGEKLGYVRLVEHYNNEDTGLPETRELLKYVDSAYAKRILLPYNKNHKTHLTAKELFEDGFKIQTSPQ